MRGGDSAEIRRLLIAIPNWVGDVILATPVLAALRAHFAAAHIAYLMRPYVRGIIDGADWHNAEHHWPKGGLLAQIKLARELRRATYDAVLLLTNSFRSGWVTRLAGIPRRVGYARDGRTLLLTDRLQPLKKHGAFVPASVLPYYIRIAEHVGCNVADRRLRLCVTPADESGAAALREHYRIGQPRSYAVINPGAAFGAAKCWPAERFAALCDRIESELSLRCVLVGAPGEAELMRAITARARRAAPLSLIDPGTTLGTLKPLIRDAALLVCNDTGPRHYGNAFNIPTVTIFGPTHQAWTDTDYAGEIKLQIPVDCGPCQLRVCPLDHRCMTGISVDMVMDATRRIMATVAGGGTGGVIGRANGAIGSVTGDGAARAAERPDPAAPAGTLQLQLFEAHGGNALDSR